MAASILGLVDWKEVGKKLAGDTALGAVKAGRGNLLRYLQADERQRAAKQAVALFTEEFLKELEDKSPLAAAVPGYLDQFKRFIEPAAPEIAAWFHPETKSVDPDPLARMWSGLNLDPLPEDFDWQLVAQNYARSIRQHVKKNGELRQQLAIALQEEQLAFEQRFAPAFDLPGYRDFLQKRCGVLQLSAMHASTYDRRISLWSVFIPQSARESARVIDIPRELQRRLREEGHTSGFPDDEQAARLRSYYQNSPKSEVLDILRRERRLVVLGDPGSGKTSLLKYLVLRWATESEGPLPLWVDLKEYGRHPIGFKAYLDSGDTSFGLDARRVEEELRSGGAALYLDGLDEIFDAQTRSSVVEQIAAFAARYPAAPVIITSRNVGYEAERLRNAGFTHATLEDFDDDQIRVFLEKWHSIAEDDAKERVRLQGRLGQAIADSRAIRELAGNPLLLTMMAILNRNQELPRDRVELYREASRVLLHEWDAGRALLPTDIFARQEKEALLRELAGAMQQIEGGLAGNLIERESLSGIFRRFLGGLGIQDAYTKAEALVRQLTERNFILCFAGADRFSFVHRTFLEYFCAAWFVDQFEKQRSLTADQLRDEIYGAHWHDEIWHEVLRLIAGMVSEKQAGELIQFLMDLDGSSHQLANLMLAAGCLSEVRNRRALLETDRGLFERFIHEAVKYDSPQYSYAMKEWEQIDATRTRAVALIASVWRSAETRAWLLSAVQRSHDLIVRSAAVHELARGWKEEPETLSWLKDRARTDENGDVRRAAVQELAQGWKGDAEVAALLKECARSDEDSQVQDEAVQGLARGWRNDPGTLPWLKARTGPGYTDSERRGVIEELARGWTDDPETLRWLKECVRSEESAYARRAVLGELAQRKKDDPEIRSILTDLANSDRDREVRSTAIEQLARGWRDDAGILELLKERARSDADAGVRRVALQQVAEGWANDEAIYALLKEYACCESVDLVRTEALWQLRRWWKQRPEVLTLLKDQAARDGNRYVRSVAVEALSEAWSEDPDLLPWLKDLLRSDKCYDVRVTALRQLVKGRKQDPDLLPMLKEIIRSDRDEHLRSVALSTLGIGWTGDAQALEMLHRCATCDESEHVRVEALRQLTRVWRSDPATLPLLKEAARSDKRRRVRREALAELVSRWTDDPETLPLVKDRLRFDEDDEVRGAALEHLAERWRLDPQTPALLKDRARSDEGDAVRGKSLELLANYWRSDPDVPEFLQERVHSDESSSVQAEALKRLARGWKDKPGTHDLVKECARSGGNDLLRCLAIAALAHCWRDDPETLPLLKDIFRPEGNRNIRFAAANAVLRGWPGEPES